MQNKKLHRTISIVLFFIGAFLIINEKTNITGAVIGFSGQPGFSALLGFSFIVGGLILSFVEVAEKKESELEVILNNIHLIIEEEKRKHESKYKFVQGLNEIEQMINQDIDKYSRTNDKKEKRIISKRLSKWYNSIKRRPDLYFELPLHVKGVTDLPDFGLYPYMPLRGGKSKYIELDVTHYTDLAAYNLIKEDYENRKDRIMFKDTTGWAYFVSEPLPERLKIKKARTMLGTGLQDYVGKKDPRNPQSQITFKIKVPKERILVKESYYNKETGKEIPEEEIDSISKDNLLKIKKYAIAGGVSIHDIIKDSVPFGGRYVDKGIKDKNLYLCKKEHWK